MRPISMAAARVDAGLTQTEVAKMMNVSKTTVGNWEKGKSIPTLSQFALFCRIVDRPERDIILPRAAT